jgi:hypothetical protein
MNMDKEQRTFLPTSHETIGRSDDLLTHIEDDITTDVLRGGKRVIVRWNELTENERHAIASTYDLGSHTLEILPDQSILIADHGNADTASIALHLDGDEAYKLLVTLQALFQ